jgi:glutamate formiminotransferase/formiminotetrahydrofolate cyclodeaminase
MAGLIECVPNFSEGRNRATIRRITSVIDSSPGVKLLDVDPGQATNRTVVTFAGTPEDVIEAAVRAVGEAANLIDMRKHRGEHPRFGATDVCPLIPISGITMEETVILARELARRIGEELRIPVFCYESAALSDERRNLAAVRAGEYEGLEEKLKDARWKPDFGPAEFNPQSGATAVGARDFLIAYNVNLNTTSTRRANAVAFDVREKGRIKRRDDPLTGEIVRDEDGQPVYVPGSLKSVKAIGWFIEEYGVAQISMNLTNIKVTPLHIAFDEVCRKAASRGLRVTGSELVGLIPLQAMLDAGAYFLQKQQRSIGISDEEIIKIAVKSLGLDDLQPFDAQKKVIEYVLDADRSERLIDQSVRQFVEQTASEAPAPGGGSVAATLGSLGAALGTMVANLSAHKRGWDKRWEEFSDWAVRGKRYQEELLALIDADTAAFNAIIEAFKLPQSTSSEADERQRQIQEATQTAIRVPLQIMQQALGSMELIRKMAEIGNPNSVSDAGVGALCARAAVRGGALNVRINSSDLADQDLANAFCKEAKGLEEGAEVAEREILKIVEDSLS